MPKTENKTETAAIADALRYHSGYLKLLAKNDPSFSKKDIESTLKKSKRCLELIKTLKTKQPSKGTYPLIIEALNSKSDYLDSLIQSFKA
jgi:hypothetical protein